MQHLRWLAFLMGVTILVITGFQIYWLSNNYDREERALSMKTNMAFQETIQKLQAAKLNIGEGRPDSLPGRVRMMINEFHDPPMRIRVAPKNDVLKMVNVLREKVSDTISPDTGKAMIIAMDRSAMVFKRDTLTYRNGKNITTDNRIFQFLYGVDSLQDSLKLHEITKLYGRTLKEDKMDVPFTVVRLDSSIMGEQTFNEATVGFARPITYRLQLGDTFPYLMKRLATPILFSFFLVGVTIFSFVLLYRSLWQQKKLADLKNEFISNITHELKTPIATVNVAIEALRNFNALQNPEKTKEYLDISAIELQRLSLLVDKVLRLSMFENKQIDLRKEKFSLKDLVEEVLAIMKLQFDKQKATVTFQTAGDNFVIEADRLHLTSVIYNLLDNALKYSMSNPEIDVLLTSSPSHIELKVKDNGIGIPAEYKKQVFDKFFRVPTANVHNTKGYGLGLSYVNEIIKRHKGYIYVDAEQEKGSVFIAKLPLV